MGFIADEPINKPPSIMSGVSLLCVVGDGASREIQYHHTNVDVCLLATPKAPDLFLLMSTMIYQVVHATRILGAVFLMRPEVATPLSVQAVMFRNGLQGSMIGDRMVQTYRGIPILEWEPDILCRGAKAGMEMDTVVRWWVRATLPGDTAAETACMLQVDY